MKFKKILLIVLIAVFLSGCTQQTANNAANETNNIIPENEIIQTIDRESVISKNGILSLAQ